QEYLSRFADQEGQVFLGRFYAKHQGLSQDEMLDAMVESRTLTPQRLAWAFRSAAPEADLDRFAAFLRRHAPDVGLSDARITELYQRSDPSQYPLVDQGYLAGVHPLEIWLVRFLSQEPG